LAGKRALEAYMLLKTQGWDAMWAMHKVRKVKSPQSMEKKEQPNVPATVGEFLALVNEKYTFKSARTRSTYVTSFLKLLSDIFNVTSGKEKYDYVNGGNRERLEKIHAIPLSQLTQDAVESWKNRALKERVAASCGRAESASTTINSTLRGCKNLFSKRILLAIEVAKEFESPFKDVSYLPEGSHRYITKFDAKKLISIAKEDLKEKNQNAYVIFLLAIGAGLRRNEIDKLLWEQVDFERKIISIHKTSYFTPKTRESSSEIMLAPTVADALMAHKEGANGPFVLDSNIQARPNAGYTHCRCKRDYKELYVWLLQNGISENNQLHTLRKEFGAQICRDHGLYMASRALRHSSYAMTERHYVDKTAPVVPSFAL
jgi:integrase